MTDLPLPAMPTSMDMLMAEFILWGDVSRQLVAMQDVLNHREARWKGWDLPERPALPRPLPPDQSLVIDVTSGRMTQHDDPWRLTHAGR